MHDVLVNRLGGLSLPRKSVARLTDRPDMTLDVYRRRKTTIQQQQQQQQQLLLSKLIGRSGTERLSSTFAPPDHPLSQERPYARGAMNLHLTQLWVKSTFRNSFLYHFHLPRSKKIQYIRLIHGLKYKVYFRFSGLIMFSVSIPFSFASSMELANI